MRYFWRFASPSTLLFALLLFPLPWIEIQCPGFLGSKNPIVKDTGDSETTITPSPPTPQPGPQAEDQTAAPAPPPAATPASDWRGNVFAVLWPFKLFGKALLVSQSGLQAAFGGWSYGEQVERERVETARLTAELDANMKPSPWLLAYPVVIVTGGAAGMWARSLKLRSAVIGLAASGALLLVATQAGLGFPLEHAYRSVRWDRVLNDKAKVPASVDDVIKEDLSYTGWFWMAQFLAVASLALLAAQWWLLYRARRTTQPQYEPEALATGVTAQSHTAR